MSTNGNSNPTCNSSNIVAAVPTCSSTSRYGRKRKQVNYSEIDYDDDDFNDIVASSGPRSGTSLSVRKQKQMKKEDVDNKKYNNGTILYSIPNSSTSNYNQEQKKVKLEESDDKDDDNDTPASVPSINTSLFGRNNRQVKYKKEDKKDYASRQEPEQVKCEERDEGDDNEKTPAYVLSNSNSSFYSSRSQKNLNCKEVEDRNEPDNDFVTDAISSQEKVKCEERDDKGGNSFTQVSVPSKISSLSGRNQKQVKSGDEDDKASDYDVMDSVPSSDTLHYTHEWKQVKCEKPYDKDCDDNDDPDPVPSKCERDDKKANNSLAAAKKRQAKKKVQQTQETTASNPRNVDGKRKRKRSTKKKVDSPEEIAASNEIDRLLQEAHDEFSKYYFTPSEDLEDSSVKESIAKTKKKLGSLVLLNLLKDRYCTRCCSPPVDRNKNIEDDDGNHKNKLAMFFNRCGGGYCCTCNKECLIKGDWTASQASKFFRLTKGGILSTILRQRSYQPCGSCHTGMFVGGDLYSTESVTLAAVNAHDSIWELHKALAMYLKRTGKRSNECVDPNNYYRPMWF